MSESFQTVKVEVYANGSWVDLMPDILVGSINGNRGIMDNGPLDRVADPGYLNFLLRNDAGNSAGKIGYYSPGHANCWQYWRTGLDVRVGFQYDDLTYYKWFGTIMPQGILPTAGIYGPRLVAVRCHDYIAQMADHEVNLLELQTNLTIDEAVPLLLANMPHAPLGTHYDAGVEVFPSVFDGVSNQAAIGVLNDLVMSELCYAYVKGGVSSGEIFVVENQNTRPTKPVTGLSLTKAQSGHMLTEASEHLLCENGDFLLLNEVTSGVLEHAINGSIKIGYGRHQTNRVLGTAFPRKVDAAATTILFNLENPIELLPNETKTGIRFTFRDPNGAAQRVAGKEVVVTATANSLADGTGTDLTAYLTFNTIIGTDGVQGEAISTYSGTMYITELVAEGKGIYVYDYVSMVTEDTTSQTTYQAVLTTSINCRYQSDPTKVALQSYYILTRNKDPLVTVDSASFWANRDTVSMMGFLQLEPGEKAAFSESVSAVNDDYFIQGFSFKVVGVGNDVIWTPVLTNDPGNFTTLTLNPTADTYLHGSNPTTNYGTATELMISNATYTGVGLFKFDLSSIPVGSTVYSCKLILMPVFGWNGSGNGRLKVYRCKRAWTELGATYNKYDGTNDWQTAGAAGANDRDTVESCQLIDTTHDPLLVPTVLPLNTANIQAIIDGDFSNNGFVVTQSADLAIGFNYASREATLYKPELIIMYY